MGPATPTSRTGGRTAGRTLAATRLVLALVVCIGVFNAGVSQADAGKHHKLHHSSVGGKPAPPHKHQHHADAQDVLKPEASTDQAVAGHKHAKKHKKGGPAHAVSPPSAGADAGGADGHGRSEHAHHAKQHHQAAKNGDGHARHGKKRHHVDDRPSQLEEFGTTGGDGEEPKKAQPAPTAPPAPAPVDPAAERMPGPHPASVPASVQRGSRWSEDVKVYGACLEEFAKLVQPTNCAKHELGDADYFLQMLDQEQHTVTAGYKTGMARAGLVIEGLGLNATSDEATALLRHAVQRSRVQLAHACAAPESRCSKEMVLVNTLDAAVGKDKNCPLQVLRMADVAPSLAEPRQLEAMRGRAAEIARAFKDTNAPSFFWADSPEYAAAVSVCYNVRLFGKGGDAPAPPGMLLKDNVYAAPKVGTSLPSLEEEDAVIVNLVLKADGNSLMIPDVQAQMGNERTQYTLKKVVEEKAPEYLSKFNSAKLEKTSIDRTSGKLEKGPDATANTMIETIVGGQSDGEINVEMVTPQEEQAKQEVEGSTPGRKLQVFAWNSEHACSTDPVCTRNAVAEWILRSDGHQRHLVKYDIGVSIRLAEMSLKTLEDKDGTVTAAPIPVKALTDHLEKKGYTYAWVSCSELDLAQPEDEWVKHMAPEPGQAVRQPMSPWIRYKKENPIDYDLVMMIVNPSVLKIEGEAQHGCFATPNGGSEWPSHQGGPDLRGKHMQGRHSSNGFVVAKLSLLDHVNEIPGEKCTLMCSVALNMMNVARYSELIKAVGGREADFWTPFTTAVRNTCEGVDLNRCLIIAGDFGGDSDTIKRALHIADIAGTGASVDQLTVSADVPTCCFNTFFTPWTNERERQLIALDHVVVAGGSVSPPKTVLSKMDVSLKELSKSKDAARLQKAHTTELFALHEAKNLNFAEVAAVGMAERFWCEGEIVDGDPNFRWPCQIIRSSNHGALTRGRWVPEFFKLFVELHCETTDPRPGQVPADNSGRIANDKTCEDRVGGEMILKAGPDHPVYGDPKLYVGNGMGYVNSINKFDKHRGINFLSLQKDPEAAGLLLGEAVEKALHDEMSSGSFFCSQNNVDAAERIKTTIPVQQRHDRTEKRLEGRPAWMCEPGIVNTMHLPMVYEICLGSHSMEACGRYEDPSVQPYDTDGVLTASRGPAIIVQVSDMVSLVNLKQERKLADLAMGAYKRLANIFV